MGIFSSHYCNEWQHFLLPLHHCLNGSNVQYMQNCWYMYNSQLSVLFQRITVTVNSLEQKRLLMDLDVSMRSGSCPYTVTFYGALFREVNIYWNLSLTQIYQLMRFWYLCNFVSTEKRVLSSHSKRRPKIDFQDWLSLNAGRKTNSADPSFIKLPFVFKTFVLSIFEWLLKTGFTVISYFVFATSIGYISCAFQDMGAPQCNKSPKSYALAFMYSRDLREYPKHK